MEQLQFSNPEFERTRKINPTKFEEASENTESRNPRTEMINRVNAEDFYNLLLPEDDSLATSFIEGWTHALNKAANENLDRQERDEEKNIFLDAGRRLARLITGAKGDFTSFNDKKEYFWKEIHDRKESSTTPEEKIENLQIVYRLINQATAAAILSSDADPTNQYLEIQKVLDSWGIQHSASLDLKSERSKDIFEEIDELIKEAGKEDSDKQKSQKKYDWMNNEYTVNKARIIHEKWEKTKELGGKKIVCLPVVLLKNLEAQNRAIDKFDTPYIEANLELLEEQLKYVEENVEAMHNDIEEKKKERNDKKIREAFEEPMKKVQPLLEEIEKAREGLTLQNAEKEAWKNRLEQTIDDAIAKLEEIKAIAVTTIEVKIRFGFGKKLEGDKASYLGLVEKSFEELAQSVSESKDGVIPKPQEHPKPDISPAETDTRDFKLPEDQKNIYTEKGRLEGLLEQVKKDKDKLDENKKGVEKQVGTLKENLGKIVGAGKEWLREADRPQFQDKKMKAEQVKEQIDATCNREIISLKNFKESLLD